MKIIGNIKESPNQLQELTNEQRDAISDPSIGMVIYNTDSNEFQQFSGDGWLCSKRASFNTGSVSTIILPEDDVEPEYLRGLYPLPNFVGIELFDATYGTFRNILGRQISSMTGTLSLSPKESDAGTGILYAYVERSLDNISWNAELFSLIKLEIPQNGESFATKTIIIDDLKEGEYFRVRMFEKGNGGVYLEAQTIDDFYGNTLTSVSIKFELMEGTTIIPVGGN